jgi:hypothetical protein
MILQPEPLLQLTREGLIRVNFAIRLRLGDPPSSRLNMTTMRRRYASLLMNITIVAQLLVSLAVGFPSMRVNTKPSYE